MEKAQDHGFSKRNTPQKHVENFTLSGLHKPATQQIADLEWRVKFTRMKLNLWRDLDNGQWAHLIDLHEAAINELKELAATYSKSRPSKNA